MSSSASDIRCIYCDKLVDKCGPLTDEHVIPYALGGNITLPSSSCRSCATITSRFETAILRGPFRAFKERIGLPSRSKNRPKSLPIFCVNGDEKKRMQIPLEHYPVTIQLPHILGPTIANYPENYGHHRMPWLFAEEGKLESLGDIYSVEQFALNEIPLSAFGRMLAKIAHCVAVNKYGPTGFVPFLRGVILGTSGEGYYRYVGSIDDPATVEGGATSHTFQLYLEQRDNIRFLVCQIRLFANLGAPSYRVVVGQLLSDFNPLQNIGFVPPNEFYLADPRLRLMISTNGFADGGGETLVANSKGILKATIPQFASSC